MRVTFKVFIERGILKFGFKQPLLLIAIGLIVPEYIDWIQQKVNTIKIKLKLDFCSIK